MELLEELSIEQLFSRYNYTVPLYQRSYAWDEAQVTQLVRDIWEVTGATTTYYIGNLIVHHRPAAGQDELAVIDGQQRLTTLNILLSVLQNEFGLSVPEAHASRLRFDSRPNSSATLHRLADRDPSVRSTAKDRRMQQAYLDMTRELKQLQQRHAGSDANHSPDQFHTCLLKRVKILQVQVPADTDLNHYFEIMNSRGEQLEKHEVLKAQLLGHLQGESASLQAGARIWDACSIMDQHMVKAFDSQLRTQLFTSSSGALDRVPDSFDHIREVVVGSVADNTPQTSGAKLLDLLDSPEQVGASNSEAETSEPRLGSVVSFPNFLLLTLKVYTARDLALDDNQLIDSFGKVLQNTPDKAAFVKGFLHCLLKCRLLLDRYVIKREYTHDQYKWRLRSLKPESSSDSERFGNTFESEADTRQAVMLLAMFHVSFPQATYKHWLAGVLRFLHATGPGLVAKDYIRYLEQLSDAFYYDRFATTPLSYHTIIFTNEAVPVNHTVNEDVLHQGTHVPNFIFNRLDYLIWKTSRVELRKDYQIPRIEEFEFTFRSSVEHFYPQNPKGEISNPLDQKILNSFGNLCLISASKNSELSNYSPKAKAEHYNKSSAIESLKQQLMMQQCNTWDLTAIEAHQQEMIGLLATRSTLP
ncbi:DUF262 domain-containing protein [Hymenobacter sp. 102]|uniref:DUF262 domain-containing protein n=1 Tax=Hymenobacter sp. 102 TaxID=3403152 RepID=UPI003CF6EF06